MSKKIPLYYSLPAILLSTLLVAAIIWAWDEPISPPPGDNVLAPINISGDSQYKSGALGIGGVFRSYSNAIFDGDVGIGTPAPVGKLNIVELDAGPNSAGDGASLVLGDPTGQHLELDSDEIHSMSGDDAALLYLNVGGGNVRLGADPVSPMDAATKGYVDSQVGGVECVKVFHDCGFGYGCSASCASDKYLMSGWCTGGMELYEEYDMMEGTVSCGNINRMHMICTAICCGW